MEISFLYRIITHCEKSLLLHNTEAKKKKFRSLFNVTVGSHDSTDVSKLLGIFILSCLAKLINQNDLGLMVELWFNCSERLNP